MSYLKSIIIALVSLVSACSSQQSITTVEYVDIERFMGDWYVIANIPTYFERDAYNPLESYRLDTDGSIATKFSFNAGSFDGEKKVYQPRAFITEPSTNAVWGMQFIWPIKADYRIVYLDDDYQTTVIGRNNLDYVWIMSRSPQMTEQRYTELERFVGALGYDPKLLIRPQHQSVTTP